MLENQFVVPRIKTSHPSAMLCRHCFEASSLGCWKNHEGKARHFSVSQSGDGT